MQKAWNIDLRLYDDRVEATLMSHQGAERVEIVQSIKHGEVTTALHRVLSGIFGVYGNVALEALR